MHIRSTKRSKAATHSLRPWSNGQRRTGKWHCNGARQAGRGPVQAAAPVAAHVAVLRFSRAGWRGGDCNESKQRATQQQ